MARHGITTFGILFVIVLISQQCRLSFAQCQISCSQTGFNGGLRYSRALEVAQNREHELEDNFGDEDFPIRYRSKRSDMPSTVMQTKSNLSTYDENEELIDIIHSRKKRSPIGDFCNSFGLNNFNISVPYISSGCCGNPALVTAYTTYNACDLVAYILVPILLLRLLKQPPPIIPCTPIGGIGCAPPEFQPQPGSPGGGGIPSGSTQIQAQNLLDRLGLFGDPVAVFPPYRDGSIFSPKGFRTFATIYTDDNNPRIAQNRQSESYGSYEPLFGVAWETFFVDNELCSEDPYAYNSCSKYDDFIDIYNQFAQSRQERNFQFIRPTCRQTCL